MATPEPMWSTQVSRHVEAPAAVVWEVLTDLEGMARHLPGILRLERLSDDGPGAYQRGTRWRETRRMFGREASEVMEVAAVDPERRTDIVAEHDGVRYDTGFDLTPAGNGADPDGTDLVFRFAATRVGEPPRGLKGMAAKAGMAVMGPLALRATRRQMETELSHIAQRAEHLAAGGA